MSCVEDRPIPSRVRSHVGWSRPPARPPGGRGVAAHHDDDHGQLGVHRAQLLHQQRHLLRCQVTGGEDLLPPGVGVELQTNGERR